jgi:hypothetical protein
MSFMTEIPLVFFILLAAALLIRSPEKYPRLILLLFVIWWLPWLHTRGFPIALFLAGLVLWQLRRHRPQAALFAVGSIVLALTTPAWNYVVYGDFSLLAQMTEHARSELAITNVFGNSLAVLFDSRYGILIHNPLYLFVIPGLLFLWLRRRGLALVLLLFAAFAVGPGLLYHHWWGGLSPARYLAVTMPAAAILVAFAYRYSNRVLRKAILVLLILSLFVGWISITDTPLITSLRSTPPALLASVSFGVADAAVLWPSWFDSGLFALHALLLLGVAVSFYSVFRLADFNPRRTLLAWCAVIALLPVWHEVSLMFQEPEFTLREAEEYHLYQRYRHERGMLLDHLNTFSVQGLPSLGYSAIRVFGREDLLGDVRAPRGRYFPLELTENTILLTEGHPLWAGEWQLEIGLAAAEPTRQKIVISNVSLRGSDTAEPITYEIDITPDYRVYAFTIQLEENSRGLEIQFPGAEGLRYAYAMLSPWDVKTISQWRGPAEAFDMPSLVHNEFVLYMQQSATHVPDSRWFWTRGNSRGSYWVAAPRRYSGLQLRLRSGLGVSVRAESGESTAEAAFTSSDPMNLLALESDAKRMGDSWWTGFTLNVDGVFRPETGDDMRSLGTHTRVSLKR